MNLQQNRHPGVVAGKRLKVPLFRLAIHVAALALFSLPLAARYFMENSQLYPYYIVHSAIGGAIGTGVMQSSTTNATFLPTASLLRFCIGPRVGWLRVF